MILKFLFISLLMSSSILAISSSSWLLVWVSLEINMMMMIPILVTSHNKASSESSMKYFMVQAFASIFLLTGLLLYPSHYFMDSNFFSQPLVLMAILMKMATAPFHFWFPTIMNTCTWMNCMILTTWQKLAPLILTMSFSSIIMLMSIIASAMIGAIGGFNQIMLKSVIAYSSISHLSWMLVASMMDSIILAMYFLTYCLISLTIMMFFKKKIMNKTSQIIFNKWSPLTMMVLLNMLSLGGLPPMLGFIPKWMILENLIFMNPTLMVILIISSLITLYFYTRLMYSTFLLTQEVSWKPLHMSMSAIMLISLTMLSVTALPMMLIFSSLI